MSGFGLLPNTTTGVVERGRTQPKANEPDFAYLQRKTCRSGFGMLHLTVSVVRNRLSFPTRQRALGLDPVAPVQLRSVERRVGSPDQRLGRIVRAPERDAEARRHTADLRVDLLRHPQAQPLGQLLRLCPVGLQRDE